MRMQPTKRLDEHVLRSNFSIRADFDVDLNKLDADGNVVSTRRALEKCPNLITNTGMDWFGIYHLYDIMAALHVGTGTTAPAFTDTVLETKRAAVAAGGVGDHVAYYDTVNPHAMVYRRVYTFSAGAASGALTELGFARTTNGSIGSHSQFKDAFGDPTVVDVDSDEQLVVTYRLYIVPAETDSVLVKTQGGTEYTLTHRLARLGVQLGSNPVQQISPFGSVGSYERTVYYGATSGIGPITGVPTGSSSGPPNWLAPVLGSTVSGVYSREDSFTIPLNEFNYNDIGAFLFTSSNPFQTQIGITPRLNKTSNDTIKFKVILSWGRL